jgi:hypothetical protein
MNVDETYLKHFATQVRGKPVEIALNGYEQPWTHVINIDDADGTYLAVTYRDDYASVYEAVAGADKRETFVMVKRGTDTVGSVGYRFAGLIALDDLRSWYRRKHDLDAVASSEGTDG